VRPHRKEHRSDGCKSSHDVYRPLNNVGDLPRGTNRRLVAIKWPLELVVLFVAREYKRMEHLHSCHTMRNRPLSSWPTAYLRSEVHPKWSKGIAVGSCSNHGDSIECVVGISAALSVRQTFGYQDTFEDSPEKWLDSDIREDAHEYYIGQW
jgi:hypothetical protein